MNKNKVTHVEFEIGNLPEWYDESEHDFYVEEWLEEVAQTQFGDADISVETTYAYSGQHSLKAWNESGDLITNIPFDMNGAFLHAKNN